MLSKNKSSEMEQIEMVSLAQMVPENHFLRKVEKYIDFTFIYELVEDLYSPDQGRPSIDPVVLIKLMLLQYLYGIRSMRQTIAEVEVNLAYRWFLGLGFHDKVPHFSTFSKNYSRRFEGTDLFEKIFENILTQIIQYRLVDLELQFVDSTHVKAHANKNKKVQKVVNVETKAYQKQLEKEVQEERKERNQKPLKPPKNPPAEKTVKESTTDPESGFFHKGEHKDVFAYCVQTACDISGWILNFQCFPGNLHDSTTFFPFLEKIKGLPPKRLVMDAGYKNPATVKICAENGIQAVLPYSRPKGRKDKDLFPKKEFIYDEYNDAFLCPEDQMIPYRRTNREGQREYKSDPKICKACPSLSKCTKSKNHQKVLHRHIWQDYLDECEEYRYTARGKLDYSLRKQTIERNFGSAKEHHGFRYTNMKGLEKMTMKSALTFACLNIKKLVGVLTIRDALTEKRMNMAMV